MLMIHIVSIQHVNSRGKNREYIKLLIFHCSVSVDLGILCTTEMTFIELINKFVNVCSHYKYNLLNLAVFVI